MLFVSVACSFLFLVSLLFGKKGIGLNHAIYIVVVSEYVSYHLLNSYYWLDYAANTK
jgi:hypothetical protein